MKVVFLALVLALSFAQSTPPNYQERQIYYNEEDNVCEYGSGNDEVFLSITVDGYRTKDVIVNTRTHCQELEVRDANRIAPMSRWSYHDSGSDLRFKDESR